jgi:hypothetical protein
MGMMTSWEDTSISKDIWNFCEVTNTLPTAKEQLFEYCRKSDGFRNLGFVDTPPLRIILDVSKGDGSHSSTSSGKAAMLATRMRTPRDEFLPSLMLASYMQDGMLRTSMSSDPKYLPSIMGGSGCRPICDSPVNLHLYVHAYKNGRCSRVYGTATRELHQCLEILETRNQVTMPVFCHRLRDKQEYLHGTYAEKVFVPSTRYRYSMDERLPSPILEASGGANWFSATENRLVRTKALVTRTIAVREWAFTSNIRDRLLRRGNPVTQLDNEERKKRSALRREFGDALNANTAFANLLARKATPKDVRALMGNPDFLPINTGVTGFSMWDAEWLNSGGKSEFFSIEDLTSTEDLFVRTEVSEEETFKVSGLVLRPLVSGKAARQVTTSRVGLYQISETMLEWSNKKLEMLQSARGPDGLVPREEARRIFYEDREWVNDDTHLIGQCLRDTERFSQRTVKVLLVSADKRLANKMANTCNVPVHLFHPIHYIKWCIDGGLDYRDESPNPEIFDVLTKSNTSKPDPYRYVYIDTGSVSAFLAQMQEEQTKGQSLLYRRDLVETGVDQNGHRFERYDLRTIPSRDVSSVLKVFQPVLKDRKSRAFRPRYSSSSYGRRGSYATRSTTSGTARP